MDDQNDGHTVDVDVGQLRVEDVELELVVEVVSMVLDNVVTIELDEESVALEGEDDADDEEADVVRESVLDAGFPEPDVVLGSVPDAELPGPDVVLESVLDAELAESDVSVTEPGLLAPDVDDGIDCTAQDATDGLEPAQYTFKRSGPPHVSAVFPLQGI